MKMEQNVPKRRHINFRCRGIAQTKEYSSAFMFWDVLMNGTGWTFNIAICKLFHVLESYKLQWFLVGFVTISVRTSSIVTAQHNFPETTCFHLQVKFCLQVNSPEDGSRYFPRRSLVLCSVTMEELAISVIGRTSVCVCVCAQSAERHVATTCLSAHEHQDVHAIFASPS